MDFDLNNYRILVTGASGMMGTRLSKKLIECGAEVIGLQRTSTDMQQSSGDLVVGDMADKDVVDQALRILTSRSDCKKLAIFHMAAMSDAKECEDNSQEAFKQNVILTENLIEACLKYKVKRILYPSTAYVYGRNYSNPIPEDLPLKPEGIYALTKMLAEETIKGNTRLFDLSCDILRVSNIYGPEAKANTVFGTMLDQVVNNDHIELQNLSSVRDFIYIEDVIEAFVRILIAGEESGYRTYNLSTAVGTSVGQLAEILCKERGWLAESIKCKDQSDINSTLVLDNSLLHERVNWKPQYSVRAGVQDILKQLKVLRHVET